MEKLSPNPYCETLPGQLKSWDSTALRAYMMCPRSYQLGILEGWRTGGDNADLIFGSFYHECVEFFDTLMAQGVAKPEATDQTIQKVLEISWLEGKPWGGEYITSWRCNNWIPGKRNKYNCEASRSWFAGHRQPATCPKCHQSVTNRWYYVPEHKVKNRYTLLASVLHYCDEAKEVGGIQPLVFPDGQIALELSFSLPLPWPSPDGDPYQLCGHMDGMVNFGGEHAVRERKTTRSNVSAAFWDRYAPDVQIDNYDLAAHILYGDTLKPQHVMIEVMQVDANMPKLHRGLVSVTQGRREETLNDIGYWIKKAEADAAAGYWPKNTSSCHAYGRGCQFCRVCKEEPGETRQRILESYYHVDRWNPARSRETDEHKVTLTKES